MLYVELFRTFVKVSKGGWSLWLEVNVPLWTLGYFVNWHPCKESNLCKEQCRKDSDNLPVHSEQRTWSFTLKPPLSTLRQKKVGCTTQPPRNEHDKTIFMRKQSALASWRQVSSTSCHFAWLTGQTTIIDSNVVNFPSVCNLVVLCQFLVLIRAKRKAIFLGFLRHLRADNDFPPGH